LISFARNIGGLVFAALVMSGVVLVVRERLVAAEVAPAGRLAICTALGLILYAPLAAALEPALRSELRGLRARLRMNLSTR
jgi:hypothetical protein